MSVLYYKMRRFGRTKYARLCDAHADARRVLEWNVHAYKRKPRGNPPCDDCGTAKNTVLEAGIAVADASARQAEPTPVPVLPGQRELPLVRSAYLERLSKKKGAPVSTPAPSGGTTAAGGVRHEPAPSPAAGPPSEGERT